MQTQGMAMGTRLTLAYANIFMYNLERHILEHNSNIIFWKRYINEIICVINAVDEHTISDLITSSNAIDHCIQFTCKQDPGGYHS